METLTLRTRKGSLSRDELISLIARHKAANPTFRKVLDEDGNPVKDKDGEDVVQRIVTNPEFRNEVIEANLGLIASEAEKYSTRMEFDDLFQVGVIGLDKACEMFDENEQTRFSTYARPWIRAKIGRFVEEQKATVRRSSNLQNYIREFKRMQGLLSHELCRKPTWDEVGEALMVRCALKSQVWTMKKADEVNNAIQSGNSMSINRRDDDDDRGSMDDLESLPSSDNDADDGILVKRMLKELGTLTQRQRDVVNMRFFEGLTLEQVGKKLCVTRERIRQIETEALSILKIRMARIEPSVRNEPSVPGLDSGDVTDAMAARIKDAARNTALTFKQIEVRFGLKRRNGQTVYRIVNRADE